MNSFQRISPRDYEAHYAQLSARFQPVFDRIAEGAVARERARILPHEPIAWLKEAGFTRIRVPEAYGGDGASVTVQARLLIDLAAADSNIPQALRAHVSMVEDALNRPETEAASWLRRFAVGETFGSAWTELGNRQGEVQTLVTADPAGGWRLNGRKFYSTGTIFADWIDVFARDAASGEDVIALVPANAPGVTREDDWKGFGQSLTGSGTTVFEDVRLTAEQVVPFRARFAYQTAFYQLILNVTQAGIARAILRDGAEAVRSRRRGFSHGSAALPADDPQIQQVIGRLSVTAFALEAAVLASARSLDVTFATLSAGGDAEAEIIRAELDAGHAQVLASQLVPAAATQFFDALGASATDRDAALDRHWRNSRTIAQHNPAIFKERVIGDHAINGTVPVGLWQVGEVPAKV